LDKNYQIWLRAKNEGIEYRDDDGVYRFDVALMGNEWSLFIPGSKGENYTSYELSREEADRILPRIIQYLQRTKWFGLFGKSYSVAIKKMPSSTTAIELFQRK
jgi:hypothetical protein